MKNLKSKINYDKKIKSNKDINREIRYLNRTNKIQICSIICKDKRINKMNYDLEYYKNYAYQCYENFMKLNEYNNKLSEYNNKIYQSFIETNENNNKLINYLSDICSLLYNTELNGNAEIIP